MPQDQVRRLAAIMVLDVAGYSALMARDEAGTLARVTSLRRDIVEPEVARHGGRVVKLMGDGALVEFAAATAAVDCAVRIQAAAAAQGTGPDLPQLRIGINLGEVIAEGDDIFGSGVNVAARIEALAEPGGIAVSAAVHEQVRKRLPVRFEDMGAHTVKNIPEPVRVWRVALAGRSAGSAAAASGATRFDRRVAVAAAAVIGLAVLAGWLLTPNREEPAPAPVTAAVSSATKPSIAVMPFENLSGDPQQGYFSDGFADNLITDLSGIRDLLVIARNTSFSFRDRGEPSDPTYVSEELGVRYVVLGSVQKDGNRVRINTSLVDGRSGYQLWAGRMDRDLDDLFALQDAVTAQIIDALQIELSQEERRRLSKRYTTSLEAYDLYLRAWEEIWRFNEEGRVRAQALLTRAIEIDPNYALAKAILATTYTNRNSAFLSDPGASLDRAFVLAKEAVVLDPDLPAVHASLGLVHMFRREYVAAETAFARALELDPNNADVHGMRAWNQHYAGHPEQALEGMTHAFRLNPRAPFPYVNALAEIHFSLGNYEETIRLNLEANRRNPEALRQRLFLAAAYVHAGQMDEAEWQVQEVLLLQPELTLQAARQIAPYADQKVMSGFLDALRQAGMPE